MNIVTGSAAFLFLLTPILALAQSSSIPREMASDLAERIAEAIPAGSPVRLVENSPNVAGDGELWRGSVVEQLTTRGVRVVTIGSGVPSVRLGCLTNLRERVCLAEVRSDRGREVVMVTRSHSGAPEIGDGALAVDLHPLFAQPEPILDVAVIGDRALVLDPTSVALFQQSNGSWRRVQSRQIPPLRRWPRDVRGRLSVDAENVEAFLPGVRCATNVNLLSLTCTEKNGPWPIAFENTGLDAARNHFNTPEGLPFYSAAPLGADAGARWLVVDRAGELAALDETRRPVVTGLARAGDIAGLRPRCGTEPYVLAGSQEGKDDGGDVLRLFRMVRHKLVLAAAPLLLPGVLTVLWPTADPTMAILVVRDVSAERYEALQATVSCLR